MPAAARRSPRPDAGPALGPGSAEEGVRDRLSRSSPGPPKKTPTGVGWNDSATPISVATFSITSSAGVRRIIDHAERPLRLVVVRQAIRRARAMPGYGQGYAGGAAAASVQHVLLWPTQSSRAPGGAAQATPTDAV